MAENVTELGTVVYDPGKRAAAGRLAQEHPGWVVMWGPHSRLYYAYPASDALPGTMITATSSGGLRARLRQAELAAQARQPAPQHPAQPSQGGPRHD